MKKTKVIIPALGLLLLSTAASVTGTVAWFAANTTVEANGMTVTVKSDSSFLLIKKGHAENAAAVQSSKLISDSATTATGELLPCAHESAATTISTIDATTGEAPNINMTNWYYYFSDDPADHTAAGSKHTIASSKFDQYVLANEFSLSIAVGGNEMTDIHVEECTIDAATGGAEAVKVLVATATASEEFDGSGDDGSTSLQASLTDSTVMYVKIYIYWDGDDDDVYSNNIANLLDTEVTVTFTGTVA